MNNNYDDNDDWGVIVDCTVRSTDGDKHPIEPINSIRHEDRREDKPKFIDHIDIDDIRRYDLSAMNDLALLEKSSLIAKNLKFQFTKRHDEDTANFLRWILSSLDWLNTVMIELSYRNTKNPATEAQQKQLSKPKLKRLSPISRNSYKFCEFGATCRYVYRPEKDRISKEKNKCYSQHFVFGLVSKDISETIAYIVNTKHIDELLGVTTLQDIITALNRDRSSEQRPDTVIKKYFFLDSELIEIRTSINTVTYVINHMYDELTNLLAINKKAYESIKCNDHTPPISGM